jgi:hypothetical protein
MGKCKAKSGALPLPEKPSTFRAMRCILTDGLALFDQIYEFTA